MLRLLFDEVYVPQSVYYEIVKAGNDKKGSEELKNANWVKVLKANNEIALRSIMIELDKGEAEVISIAKEKDIKTVIIDEVAGRRYAQMLDLKVSGTLGILLLAKAKKHINEIKPLLDQLITNNRYISNDLYKAVLIKAGESHE